MDYASTLKNSSFLNGLKELVADSDYAVSKRAIHTYYNIFRNVFSFWSKNELEEEDIVIAWPQLSMINQIIMNTFSHENEGVHLISVRFLEMSLSKVLSEEYQQHKKFASVSRQFTIDGLKLLKELAFTQYIGASVFIVVVKSLIRISCVRTDLHNPVMNAIEKVFNSPPPTLFDHNVRSMNKIFVINLFKLLKIIDSDHTKERIIEVMVKCGASRKKLSPWAPKKIKQKKKEVSQEEKMNIILGRISPPSNKINFEKLSKLSSSKEKRKSTDVNDSETDKNKYEDCQPKKKIKFTDKVSQVEKKVNSEPSFPEKMNSSEPSFPEKMNSPEPNFQEKKMNSPVLSFPEKMNSPEPTFTDNMKSSKTCIPKKIISPKHILQIENKFIIDENKGSTVFNTEDMSNSSEPFLQSSHIDIHDLSEKEQHKQILKKLTVENVISLIISSIDNLPDSIPDNFISDYNNIAVNIQSVDCLKNNIANIIRKEQLYSQHEFSLISNKVSLPYLMAFPESQSKFSAPSSENPICIIDVDMRQQPYKIADVDMRMLPSNSISNYSNLAQSILRNPVYNTRISMNKDSELINIKKNHIQDRKYLPDHNNNSVMAYSHITDCAPFHENETTIPFQGNKTYSRNLNKGFVSNKPKRIYENSFTFVRSPSQGKQTNCYHTPVKNKKYGRNKIKKRYFRSHRGRKSLIKINSNWY